MKFLAMMQRTKWCDEAARVNRDEAFQTMRWDCESLKLAYTQQRPTQSDTHATQYPIRHFLHISKQTIQPANGVMRLQGSPEVKPSKPCDETVKAKKYCIDTSLSTWVQHPRHSIASTKFSSYLQTNNATYQLLWWDCGVTRGETFQTMWWVWVWAQ